MRFTGRKPGCPRIEVRYPIGNAVVEHPYQQGSSVKITKVIRAPRHGFDSAKWIGLNRTIERVG